MFAGKISRMANQAAPDSTELYTAVSGTCVSERKSARPTVTLDDSSATDVVAMTNSRSGFAHSGGARIYYEVAGAGPGWVMADELQRLP